jgi:hypothetical protein
MQQAAAAAAATGGVQMNFSNAKSCQKLRVGGSMMSDHMSQMTTFQKMKTGSAIEQLISFIC